MAESKPIRYGILALVGLLTMGLVWLGVVQWFADQRSAEAAGLPAASLQAPAAAVPAAAEAKAEVAAPLPAPASVPEPQSVFVHVAGAVARPGVFRLEQGARVADALSAAGGALAEGAPDMLNLAATVADGDKIYVYTREEAGAQGCPPAAAQGASHGPVVAAAGNTKAATAASPPGKVNVNTASKTELKSVPGIGDTTASRILDYRAKNGPFKRLEDLVKVNGIGPATLEKLRPYLTL